MTNREFYNAIIEANVSEEITSYATAQIEKLDECNARRRSSKSPKQIESLELAERIYEALTSEPKTAKEIASEFEVTQQKVSAVVKLLEDRVVVTEVKNGNRLVKAYSVA